MRGKWRHKKLVVSEPVTPKVRVYLKMLKLSEIVYQRHFSSLSNDKEDLISIGVVKALHMLERGDFDAEKGSMMNYLYAGVRNSMYNHYMKNISYGRKEVLTDVLPSVVSEVPLYDLVYHVDFNMVYKPLYKFHRRFGDLRGWALQYLESVECFIITNPPDVEVIVPPRQAVKKLEAFLLWSVVDQIIV